MESASPSPESVVAYLRGALPEAREDAVRGELLRRLGHAEVAVPSGRFDPTFGTGGVRRIQLAAPGGFSVLEEIVLQPDGKIVAVADLFGGSEEGMPRILRYLPDGSLDPSFGNGGQVVVNPGGDIQIAAAAIQDGQLLVAGYRCDGPGNLGFVSRYLLNPLPDPQPPTPGAGPSSTAEPPTPGRPGKGSQGGAPSLTPLKLHG